MEPGARADRHRADAKSLLLHGAGLLIALPLWLWWAVWKGGGSVTVFLPAVVYLAGAVVVLHLWAPRPRLRGPLAVAVAALAGLALWSLLSLLWADDQGAAEIATARHLLFLASFALPALWPPSERALVAGAMGFSLVAAAGGISALAGVMGDAAALPDGRLVAPTGYANASAALFAMGALPAVVAASCKRLNVSLRAAGIVVAGLLVGLSVLTQSRGGLASLALALAVAFALVPRRLGLLVPVLIVGASVLAILDPLLEVHRASVDGGDVGAAVDGAVRALGLLAAALVPVGLLYALVDGRVRISGRMRRNASVVARLALGAAAAAGVVALLAAGPDVGDWISDRADDFKTPDYARLESGDTRFSGDLGSNRYDYWRASTEIFVDQPLTGSGAGNFIAPYLEIREGEKSTIYAHSLWFGTLAELGAPGFFALLLFLAALTAALLRRLAARGASAWAPAAATLPLVYALVHGSVDWIWAFPVVTAPALALAAASASFVPESPWSGYEEAVNPRRGIRSASLWLTLAMIVAALAALPLFTAARLADRGASTWPARPAAALEDLQRAAELDPLAAAPQVRRGIVAIELRRLHTAREAFESSLERDASAWYPRFQLGLIALRSGSRLKAREFLEAARRRNPGEREVRRALRALKPGRSYDPVAAQHEVLGGRSMR